MDKIYRFFGGKKYFIIQESIALTTTLLCLKYITEQTFAMVICAGITVYAGANLAEKVWAKKDKKIDEN